MRFPITPVDGCFPRIYGSNPAYHFLTQHGRSAWAAQDSAIYTPASGKLMTLARLRDSVLIRNWWAVVLRGIATLLFGLAALIMPGITVAALILLFGIYSLADGIFAVISVMRKRFGSYWWGVLLQGIVGIGVGIFTLIWPDITAVFLLYVVAIWAIVGGVLQVFGAIRLRKVIQDEWLLAVVGILTIALGLLLLARPVAGVLAAIFWIGIYAVMAGVLTAALGMKMRRIYKDVHRV